MSIRWPYMAPNSGLLDYSLTKNYMRWMVVIINLTISELTLYFGTNYPLNLQLIYNAKPDKAKYTGGDISNNQA
jgi:hypothetical protein